jgi:phage terminase large subunit-like protein
VYGAATDLEQASLAFNVAAQMVRNDRELGALVEIIPSRKRIVYHRHGSFYRAIPAEAPSAHGYNASAIIYDELHAAPDRELWDVLTTSVGARRQPLTFVITTAGFDRKSICWELHDYATKVREGIVTDPTFLPVLYNAPDAADWLDEKVWHAANPALGDFRSLDEMRASAHQAKEVPARQNTFRRLYLCQWTESETRWLDQDAWDAGAVPVDAESLRGRRCFAGLDLSTTTDLSALVLLFPDDLGEYDLLAWFWCPEEGIAKRSRRDRAPYEAWSRAGVLTPTPGAVIDYSAIRARINELASLYHVERISYDPWNARQLVTQLEEQDGLPLVEMRQGFASLAAPTKELERLVSDRAIRHGGHPVLRWNVANVVVEQDANGNMKPSKKKSTERIDGVLAMVMALDGAVRSAGGSVYDERMKAGESVLTVF